MPHGAATSRKRIRDLIEEATVDAHSEDEQEMGFLTLIEAFVPCPFPACVVGEALTMIGFEMEARDAGIAAICKRKGKRYCVNVMAIESDPTTKGRETIEAYHAWRAASTQRRRPRHSSISPWK